MHFPWVLILAFSMFTSDVLIPGFLDCFFFFWFDNTRERAFISFNVLYSTITDATISPCQPHCEYTLRCAGLGNDTSKTHVFYVVLYTQDTTYAEYVSRTCFYVNKEPNWLFLTYSNNLKLLVSKLIKLDTHKKLYIS